jgi:protein N-terminal methyltransferase
MQRRVAQEKLADVETVDSWIVVKENMLTNIYGDDIYNPEDSSLTRSDANFRKLLQKAVSKIIATQEQKGLPNECILLSCML